MSCHLIKEQMLFIDVKAPPFSYLRDETQHNQLLINAETWQSQFMAQRIT